MYVRCQEQWIWRNRRRGPVQAEALEARGGVLRQSVLATLLPTLVGCDYDVAIYSIYVPPWLMCSMLGSACAGSLLYIVGRTRAAPYVGNRSVLFVALTVIVAVLLWAVLFKG